MYTKNEILCQARKGAGWKYVGLDFWQDFIFDNPPDDTPGWKYVAENNPNVIVSARLPTKRKGDPYANAKERTHMRNHL